MRKYLAAACIAVSVLAGCAGTPIDWGSARQVKVGMSKDEVTKIMGTPYMVTTTCDGELWVWSYANVYTGTKSMSLPFDKEGKVKAVPSIPDGF